MTPDTSLEIERERYYRVIVRYQKKKLLNDVLASLKGTMLENNTTFMVEGIRVRLREGFTRGARFA